MPNNLWNEGKLSCLGGRSAATWISPLFVKIILVEPQGKAYTLRPPFSAQVLTGNRSQQWQAGPLFQFRTHKPFLKNCLVDMYNTCGCGDKQETHPRSVVANCLVNNSRGCWSGRWHIFSMSECLQRLNWPFLVPYLQQLGALYKTSYWVPWQEKPSRSEFVSPAGMVILKGGPKCIKQSQEPDSFAHLLLPQLPSSCSLAQTGCSCLRIQKWQCCCCSCHSGCRLHSSRHHLVLHMWPVSAYE